MGNRPVMKRRRFTREFKIDVLRQCRDSGSTVAECAHQFGITRQLIYRWMSEFTNNPAEAFRGNGNVTRDQKRIIELGRENTRLRRECEELLARINGQATTDP